MGHFEQSVEGNLDIICSDEVNLQYNYISRSCCTSADMGFVVFINDLGSDV